MNIVAVMTLLWLLVLAVLFYWLAFGRWRHAAPSLNNNLTGAAASDPGNCPKP